MKPVAVIILNWNGERLLEEYLPEVVAATNPAVADIIVADNGSSDASEEVCRRVGVRMLKFPENYGYAGGYNRAIRQVDATYTVLLNSDVAPVAGWLDTMLEFMDQNPKTGACQPKILSRNDSAKFEYAGAAGGYIDRNGYPYCRGRIFDTIEPDNGQYDTTADIDWASGAALMVRTDVYRQVGGLDTDFFAHMEEIDLCWRIRLAGYRVVAVPAAAVLHLGGGSLPADNPRKTYLNFRNNLLLLHKNLPDGTRGRTLFRRRILDAVAWMRFIAKTDFGNAAAILRAHRDFRLMRRNYRTHPSVDLLAGRPDILTAYYLRRHRRFADLLPHDNVHDSAHIGHARTEPE